jgi:hypothetical protein
VQTNFGQVLFQFSSGIALHELYGERARMHARGASSSLLAHPERRGPDGSSACGPAAASSFFKPGAPRLQPGPQAGACHSTPCGLTAAPCCRPGRGRHNQEPAQHGLRCVHRGHCGELGAGGGAPLASPAAHWGVAAQRSAGPAATRPRPPHPAPSAALHQSPDSGWGACACTAAAPAVGGAPGPVWRPRLLRGGLGAVGARLRRPPGRAGRAGRGAQGQVGRPGWGWGGWLGRGRGQERGVGGWVGAGERCGLLPGALPPAVAQPHQGQQLGGSTTALCQFPVGQRQQPPAAAARLLWRRRGSAAFCCRCRFDAGGDASWYSSGSGGGSVTPLAAPLAAPLVRLWPSHGAAAACR